MMLWQTVALSIGLLTRSASKSVTVVGWLLMKS